MHDYCQKKFIELQLNPEVFPFSVLRDKFDTLESFPKGFPDGSVVKKPPAHAGGTGLISEWGRSPRKGDGNPLQYPCLGNSMDRGAWRALRSQSIAYDLETKQQQKHQVIS